MMRRMSKPPGALLVPVTRRFKHTRIVRAGAYKLGETLGDRVLVGRTPGGSPMALSMRDHQHRFIYFHGEYEPAITALFRRLVQPGSIVFDVGANAGYFSLLARELGASVHAFEPNPRVRALLIRSVELGGRAEGGSTRRGGSGCSGARGRGIGHGRVEVVPAACSDRDGTTTLYLSSPDNTGMSTVSPKRALRGNASPERTLHGDATVQAPVIKLDDYAACTQTWPDLIKVDVEGHEREALAGAASLLDSARPVVIAEVGGVETIDLMRSHDYLPQRIRPDGSTVPHDDTLELVGGFENICFMPTPAR
jgi:FkbM family methyltransferase